jgi:hypothetical protein
MTTQEKLPAAEGKQQLDSRLMRNPSSSSPSLASEHLQLSDLEAASLHIDVLLGLPQDPWV